MKNLFFILLLFFFSCGDFCDDTCRFNKLKEPITVVVADKKIGKIMLRDSTGYKEIFSTKTTLGNLLLNNYKTGDTIYYGKKRN